MLTFKYKSSLFLASLSAILSLTSCGSNDGSSNPKPTKQPEIIPIQTTNPGDQTNNNPQPPKEDPWTIREGSYLKCKDNTSTIYDCSVVETPFYTPKNSDGTEDKSNEYSYDVTYFFGVSDSLFPVAIEDEAGRQFCGNLIQMSDRSVLIDADNKKQTSESVKDKLGEENEHSVCHIHGAIGSLKFVATNSDFIFNREYFSEQAKLSVIETNVVSKNSVGQAVPVDNK